MAGGVLAYLSEVVGTGEPALRLLIALLLGYPIALIHRKYLYGRDQNLQYIYFAVAGFSLGFFNYGWDILHAVSAILITYAALVLLGGSALCVGVVFLFNMGYLLTGYFYSGTNDYDINWTVPQCVLVLRLIATAFDLYDGRQPPETLSAESKKTALTVRPGILEFVGHQMFPTSFLIGPQFSLKRFQDFVSGKFGNPAKPSEAPDSVAYALRRFGFGVIYLGIFQILAIFINDDYMISDEFGNLGFLRRLVLLGVWGRYSLYKYISCWLLAEGSGILFGLSYNEKDDDGNPKWNGLENVRLEVLENATEFNHYIQSFNVNTNQWVLQYIYKRLKFLNNRYVSQASALLFLAIWHGFHSGYYVCFLFEFLVMYLEKDLQSTFKNNKTVRNLMKENPITSTIAYVLLRMYTFVFMGWCLLPFVLLKFDRYWKAYANVNYVGIFLYCLFPIIYGPLIRMACKGRRPRDESKSVPGSSGSVEKDKEKGESKGEEDKEHVE